MIGKTDLTREDVEDIVGDIGGGGLDEGEVTAIAEAEVDSHEGAFDHTLLPTTTQKAALTGTGTPSGTNKYVTADSIISEIASRTWQNAVVQAELTAPPGSPVSGQRYIVAGLGGTSTGAWATHEEQIAEWNGSIWVFVSPKDGTMVTATSGQADGMIAAYVGGDWPAGTWSPLPLQATSEKNNPNGYAGIDNNGNVVPPIRKITTTAVAIDGDISVGAGGVVWRWGGVPFTVQGKNEKGQPSGYAGLNASSQVMQPVVQVKGTASGTASGSIGITGGQFTYGDGSTQRVLETTSFKGAANGYASLDANSRVVEQARKVALAATAAAGDIGINGTNLEYRDAGNNPFVVEKLSNKAAASGYASLDANSRVVQEARKVAQAATAAAGDIGIIGSSLEYRDAGNIAYTAEKVSNKSANNGYAGLSGSGELLERATLVRVSSGSGITSGAIAVNGGVLSFGDGANQRTVEMTSNKGIANGYAGLDPSGRIPAAQSTNVFVSTEITGDGTEQATPHALGTTPRVVIAWPTDTGITYVCTPGTHNASNAYFTVTTGCKYIVTAIV